MGRGVEGKHQKLILIGSYRYMQNSTTPWNNTGTSGGLCVILMAVLMMQTRTGLRYIYVAVL